jgi:uncharacterized membrane protein
MTARNPFRKYRNKYVDKFLLASAVALALFSYIMAVYGYKLPLIFPEWALGIILSTILAGFVILYLAFAMIYYAFKAMYFWRLERLFEMNPRLAVWYFYNDYMSPEAKLVRKALRFFGLS